MEKVLGFIVVLYITSFWNIFVWILSTVLEKMNVFAVNTNLGKVSMIANDMFFRKISSNSIGKVLGFIVFLCITSFKTFSCEFNRQLLRKSMFFK